MGLFSWFGIKKGDGEKLDSLEGCFTKTEQNEIKGLISSRRAKLVEGDFGTTKSFFSDSRYFYISTDDAKSKAKVKAYNDKLAAFLKKQMFEKFAPKAEEKILSLIAPQIIGREDIKAAGLLQLFSKEKIHILLLGDPSTGKTVILRSISELAPISSFGLGSGTSKAGLTLAMSGKEVIQGILPQANNGIACIDELNLMKKEDLAGLLNAMEKGFITYDKGNSHLKVDAHVKIFASANPSGDKFKGTAIDDMRKQLPFDDALLSRFHIIFTLKKPDKKEFLKITQKIISDDKVQANKGDIEFASEYIAYALEKEVIFDEALSAPIQEFMEQLKEDEDKLLFGVSPRLVIGIISLVKASARLRLSGRAEEKDVKRAIGIVKKAVYLQ